MNNNDLSDEAIVLFLASKNLTVGDISGCWVGWQECRRRAEGIIHGLVAEDVREIDGLKEQIAELKRNRWAAFSDEELRDIQVNTDIWYETRSELSRRSGLNQSTRGTSCNSLRGMG